MSDELIDVRTPLAAAEGVRVEIGRDGTLHVVLPAITLHLEQAACERITTTLARALVRLHKFQATSARPPRRQVRHLRVVNEPRPAKPEADPIVESSNNE